MPGAMSRQWSTSTLVYGTQAVANQPKGFLASKSDAELEAELAAPRLSTGTTKKFIIIYHDMR